MADPSDPGQTGQNRLPPRSVLVVLASVVINMAGVGLMWPIIPALVERLSGSDVSSVSIIVGGLTLSYALMQFVFAPILGALSDRYGRRPVMLIALAGLGFDTILMGFAPSIIWLFAARLLGGALASTFALANAIIADVYTGKERAAGFGKIGAAFGIGFIIGPVLGGVLGEIDLRLPFFVAGAMAIINCVFGYFFLVETLPEKTRKQQKPKRRLWSSLNWILDKRPILPLVFVHFITNIFQRGLEAIWVIFAAYQYLWGSFEAGLSLAIVGLTYFVVQGFLVKPVLDRFSERFVMVSGLVLSAIVYFALAFNTNGFIGFIGVVPHVIGWGLAQTVLQSTISQKISADEQGQLQGSLSAVSSLATIIGPVLATMIFAWFTSDLAPFKFAGAYFVLCSLFLLIAAVIASRA